jgi:8-amino-3,8-dideoxy-alpha-D-manno-octulosonate transaminase
MPSRVQQSELAINGGPKAVTKLEAPSRPKIGVEEFMELADLWGFSAEAQAKIRAAIENEDLGPGPHLTRYYNPRPSKVVALEQEAARFLGAKYVLALHSGTSALETAYVAAGIGPGCEVIVPAYTFFATAAAVVSAKAIPVIAEIDESLTIDPQDVARKIGPHTKAIVPVHMIGTVCDMGPLMALAREYGLLVIEDVAQAFGAEYHGKRCGTWGHLGCFSISTYKYVGGGEAGLVVTDDEMLYIRAQNHHDTGACWRPDRYGKERMPGELFCGTNYRMSELEGAVNLWQIRKAPARLARHRQVYRQIVARLRPHRDIVPQQVRDLEGHVGYSLCFFAPEAAHAHRLVEALRAEGVDCAVFTAGGARDWHIYRYWEHILEQKSATPEGCPWTCPYYAGPLPPYSEDMCPRTLDLLSRGIRLGLSEWWTENDCAQIAAAINKVLGAFHEPIADAAWHDIKPPA